MNKFQYELMQHSICTSHTLTAEQIECFVAVLNKQFFHTYELTYPIVRLAHIMKQQRYTSIPYHHYANYIQLKADILAEYKDL